MFNVYTKAKQKPEIKKTLSISRDYIYTFDEEKLAIFYLLVFFKKQKEYHRLKLRCHLIYD